MDKGRFAVFFSLIILLGLLQMWVIVIVMRIIGQPIGSQQLLGDGGLFFFANSLTIGSAVSLYDKEPVKIVDANFLITFFVGGIIFLATIICVVSIMANGGSKDHYPFDREDMHLLQVACTSGAIMYWIYCGRKTGLFVNK